MQVNKGKLIIEVTQALIWACLCLLPSVLVFMVFHDIWTSWWTFKVMLIFVLPPLVVYFVNYYLLINRYLFTAQYAKYIFLNIFLLLLTTIVNNNHQEWTTAIPEKISGDVPANIINVGISGFLVLELIFQVMVILMAVGMKSVIRWNEEKHAMEEERRRNAEAELNWLKNQLNPHFLFNTFNNISSLTLINPDRAQECIGKLSELLRYALYDTNAGRVRVVDEVVFMRNYIDLMSLRCNERTRICTKFDDFDSGLTMPPLMFISLIENAFKHGSSSHVDSFIRIDMGLDGDDLVFSCENTHHEREIEVQGGSGIGVENMLRRFELLYPDMYSYTQFVEDGSYVAIVRIKNMISHD